MMPPCLLVDVQVDGLELDVVHLENGEQLLADVIGFADRIVRPFEHHLTARSTWVGLIQSETANCYIVLDFRPFVRVYDQCDGGHIILTGGRRYRCLS